MRLLHVELDDELAAFAEDAARRVGVPLQLYIVGLVANARAASGVDTEVDPEFVARARRAGLQTVRAWVRDGRCEDDTFTMEQVFR